MKRVTFESAVEGFVQRFYDVGLKFFDDNPEWMKAAGLQMIGIAIQCLQRHIEDPKKRHVDWDTPLTMVPVGVDITDTFEPIPYRVSPRDFRNRKTMARATLRAIGLTRMCFLLFAATRGVAVIGQRGKYYVYLPPKVERELRNLPARKSRELEEELVNPRPIPLAFKFRGTWKKGKPVDITAGFEVIFSPLYVDDDLGRAFYPVWIRMTLTGTNHRRWSKEFKTWFWRKIVRIWKSRIPKENLACFSELKREMRLAKVIIEELVDPEHARDYKELVQSFATCQSQCVGKTGKFFAVEGTFNVGEANARTHLTPKQARDYKKHDYKRYDKIRVPGAIPLKRSNSVFVNGIEIRMGDSDLSLFLGLAADLKRGKGGWVHIDSLTEDRVVSKGGKYQAFGRLRKALQSALPAAATLLLVQGDDLGKFRLSVHPDFVEYDRGKLRRHPDGCVREVAMRLPLVRSTKARPKT